MRRRLADEPLHRSRYLLNWRHAQHLDLPWLQRPNSAPQAAPPKSVGVLFVRSTTTQVSSWPASSKTRSAPARTRPQGSVYPSAWTARSRSIQELDRSSSLQLDRAGSCLGEQDPEPDHASVCRLARIRWKGVVPPASGRRASPRFAAPSNRQDAPYGGCVGLQAVPYSGRRQRCEHAVRRRPLGCSR